MQNTLFSAIKTNTRIRQSRKEKVIDILKEHNIFNYEDLTFYKIPLKGLTANEIKQLQLMKGYTGIIAEAKHRAIRELYFSIGDFTSKHEQTRITNILVSKGIFSKRLLYATPIQAISNIPGIGKKSIEVLQKVIFKFCCQLGLKHE